MFGRSKKGPSLSSPADLDLLFGSPEFVQKYVTLSQSQKDSFMQNMSQKDLDRYLEQGRATKAKHVKDFGY